MLSVLAQCLPPLSPILSIPFLDLFSVQGDDWASFGAFEVHVYVVCECFWNDWHNRQEL